MYQIFRSLFLAKLKCCCCCPPEYKYKSPVKSEVREGIIPLLAMAAAVDADHVYVKPQKEIHKNGDILKWLKSDAYNEYLSFLEALSDSVKGKPLSHPLSPSPVVSSIVHILDTLDKYVDEIPPVEQPQRFGNRAFKTWYEKVQDTAVDLLQEALPQNFHPALVEIPVYLIEGFGNATRIDYGTGHEMSFVMFMYCLFRIGALDNKSADDRIAAVTKIFNRYMILVRKLQQTYRMEPAGSHGVWSLDDYQFVPFIWGSSQLIGNPKYDPQTFTEESTVSNAADDYMFMACIQYIMQVKSGPFFEHSNYLWNISGTQSWHKVNQGLMKMYKAEVLAKFPVIQHTLFGSLFSIQAFDLKKGKPRLGFGVGAGLDRLTIAAGPTTTIPASHAQEESHPGGDQPSP